MPFVTFLVEGRTGNNIFQYLISKVLHIRFGHTYIPIDEIENINAKLMQSRFDKSYFSEEEMKRFHVIYEGDIEYILAGNVPDIADKDIVCIGYFQRSEIYLPYRNELLRLLKNSDEYWIKNVAVSKLDSALFCSQSHLRSYGEQSKKVFIKDFFHSTHDQVINENDIVVSLRLDDFIQYPSHRSDIIPPEYYLEILEKEMQHRDRLFIVSDKIKLHWEKKYIEYFQKWNPIFVQGDLFSDFAFMRDSPILLHSNSTFCWLASFFSENKIKRYIPNTHFYAAQSLKHIEENDTITDILTFTHDEVHHLDMKNYLKRFAYPLSYSIPDEYIVPFSHSPPIAPLRLSGQGLKSPTTNLVDDLRSSDKFVENLGFSPLPERKAALQNLHIENKITEVRSLIPEQKSVYKFGPNQEKEYLQNYRDSFFSHTRKKGGWDCLRHYEILANGCIPIFPELEKCPSTTMTTFPKQLVIDANRELIPFTDDKIPLYKEYLTKLLQHTRENCSTTANTVYFLEKIKKPIKNVLLIVGHHGVNYTREMFWIGMKRYIQSLGGVAVEYPRLDFVYKDFPEDKKENLHGNGFIYTNKLDDDYCFSEDEIIEKIKTKFFDIVVYGKVGPDEMETGTLPNFPLWEHVFKRYSRNEIVCLYGGDECINLTYVNKYSQHFFNTSQYATCFIRELIGGTDGSP